MTSGKTHNGYRFFTGLKNNTAVAITLTLAVACFLFTDTNTAQGQSLDPVPELVPEITSEEFQSPNFSNSIIESAEPLAPSEFAPSELASPQWITDAQQEPAIENVAMEDLAIDFVESDSTGEFFHAPPAGRPCTFCAATQTIEIRKNVLGCRGCYTLLPQDEIWIVSARGCSCDPENLDLIKVKKLENNNWQPSSLDELSNCHQTDTSRTTMLYVHGNQTNYEYGVSRGVQFYNNLFVKYECPRPPVRLVLWLWQSEREAPRLYSDYIVKSRRAVTMGKTLTRTLESIGSRKLAIVGFSLGAQVVLSALEQMEPGKGCVFGDTNPRNKYNVALIAPATDPNYICGKVDCCAPSTIVRQSTVIVNDDDRAVKAMRFVIRHECPEARDNFCELAESNHLPLGKTEFFEISQEICRKHSIVRYTNSPTAQRAIAEVLNRTTAAAF